MEIFYGTAREITAWMQLVRLLRAEFPGLETEAALEEHRQTVLRFMEKGHAIGMRKGDALAGVMLISTRLNMLCCLGVHPNFRRKGVASLLMAEALKRLDSQREITVTTYRREDPRGPAARGLYKKFGFVPCELVEEMGYPNQLFTKFPAGSEAEGRWRAVGCMTEAIGEILEDCRPSIYLYGSCVLEDFRRGWSDIDLLVLTGKLMGQAQAERLVNLRQTLLAAEPENPYYRSFEGGMLTREAFVKNAVDRVVYWGTSGQRITDRYAFDSFCRAELLEKVEQLSQELGKSSLRLHEENRQVVETLQKEYNVRRIIGRCPAMRQVVAQALAIARRPINTLILGPSGTGKEIFAKTIHYHSPRRDAPFVAVNCTAIPDSLFESEMFGIEKGVATGVSARRGLVEEASGGTLFLDELADMSLPNQAKLLRVLEEREVLRVGSARPVPVDIKVIAATNVDLRQAVARGRFREDLYYRLNVAELTLPPLRERGDDILLLARHLLAQHAHNMERAALTLAPATQQCLLAYDWPGNVRELSNEMERAAALTVDTVIRPSDLSPKLLAALARHGCIKTSATAPREPLPDIRTTFNLEQAERLLVQRALDACQGNKSRAAELLGITREGLRKKLLRLDKTAHGHDGEEA